MNHLDKVKAIQHIRPDAEFILRGDEVEWLDKTQTQPTESEIQAGWIAFQAKLEAEKVEAETKRASALAKLAALGLEPDDLKALGL